MLFDGPFRSQPQTFPSSRKVASQARLTRFVSPGFVIRAILFQGWLRLNRTQAAFTQSQQWKHKLMCEKKTNINKNITTFKNSKAFRYCIFVTIKTSTEYAIAKHL